MPTVKALCNVPFGTGIRATGEEFEASDHEAKILVALRRVELVKEPKEKADPDAKAAAKPAKALKSNTYKTRDLKASK